MSTVLRNQLWKRNLTVDLDYCADNMSDAFLKADMLSIINYIVNRLLGDDELTPEKLRERAAFREDFMFWISRGEGRNVTNALASLGLCDVEVHEAARELGQGADGLASGLSLPASASLSRPQAVAARQAIRRGIQSVVGLEPALVALVNAGKPLADPNALEAARKMVALVNDLKKKLNEELAAELMDADLEVIKAHLKLMVVRFDEFREGACSPKILAAARVAAAQKPVAAAAYKALESMTAMAGGPELAAAVGRPGQTVEALVVSGAPDAHEEVAKLKELPLDAIKGSHVPRIVPPTVAIYGTGVSKITTDVKDQAEVAAYRCKGSVAGISTSSSTAASASADTISASDTTPAADKLAAHDAQALVAKESAVRAAVFADSRVGLEEAERLAGVREAIRAARDAEKPKAPAEKLLSALDLKIQAANEKLAKAKAAAAAQPVAAAAETADTSA